MISAMIRMQQVHGNNVVRVGKNDNGKTIENCDALITNDSGTILSVRVADCLPISLRDKKGHAIGLIHAGWRGLSKGIIKNTIKLMNSKFKVKSEKLMVNIGPHICKKHYEVQSDVFSKFSKYAKAPFKGASSKGGRTFLDLGEIAREQFLQSGVKNENIKIDERCTFEDLSLPSYRRDGTKERLTIKLNI